MSSSESTVAVLDNPSPRRKRSINQPPTMRIVLLGKSVLENSEVGNLILGRSAFDGEAPPGVVERVGGRLKHRHVMLINSPQLLHANISDDQITQTVRECVSLSDPGPHVVVLLLQHQQCSAEDQERVEKLQDSFSERLLQHTMVLSTQESTEPNEILQMIIRKCSNRHFSLQKSSPDDILQAFEDIEQSNEGQHLISSQSGDSQSLTVKKRDAQRLHEKLNVVVCGSDGLLKSSISELIVQHTHRSSESESTDVDLQGRQINVLELPALFNTELSEEVMRQTLHCMSLCHPGVHAFLLTIPDAPLTDQDKAEIEEIQNIFSSKVNKHLITLIMQNSEHQTAELNEETKSVIESSGGKHHFFGPKTHVSTLMENIEKMLEENRGTVFSTETFLEAQVKKLMKYEEMKKKIHSLEKHYLSKGSTESQNELRIVLLGKSGVGKSAAGNTIIGRKVFTAETSQESVTKESQSETREVNGRHITVIDTPGLFDTELTNEEIQKEISNCISMILPGPHVFIIVLNLGQRFTQEEAKSVEVIQETFGENSLMYTMVLFTRGDYLRNKTIEQCLGKPGSPLMKLIEACGNRFHVFNNNQTEDRTQVADLLEKIDNMVKANGGGFYSCKMFREMERKKQEQQMKILMDRVREGEQQIIMLEEEIKRERETLTDEVKNCRQENERTMKIFMERMEQINKEKEEIMKKAEIEKEKMKTMMESERQNREKEKKAREEEDKKRWESKKSISVEQFQKFKCEIEEIIRDKDKTEKETQEQLHDLKMRLEEERNTKEDQLKISEVKLKLLKEQHVDELKRRRVEWREEYDREKEETKKKINSEMDDPLQATAYRRLETEYSKWSRSLCTAMMEIEDKLQNRIKNEAIHKIEESDLYQKLKKTSEEVEKSMCEFFENVPDEDILIQWKPSFEIKIKELQDNTVRETKRKLNEILQQRELRGANNDQRKHHENTLYAEVKELALKLKDKENNEEILKKEFDLFWETTVNMIRETPDIKDIDLKKDARLFLSDVYKSPPLNYWSDSRDILFLRSYSEYIRLKRTSGFTSPIESAIISVKEMFSYVLSPEDEGQIRSFVSDVVQQTDRMIYSFNISEMGYNSTYAQLLTDYIRTRVAEHEEGRVKYVFKKQFFIDLVYSVCNRANKMIPDQHRLFREANDPCLYLKKKREEYYSIFDKYCHGATSSGIFAEIICQKLKEPIERSVYKKTARDLTDEMRSICETLKGNRSNLEKHILKTLAEEEDFDKYMNYIHYPRDHFKNFIRDEVSRYISDKFSISVLPKMKENIELLQQKILNAAHESVNSGDVGLWLKSFTQQLSEQLIFSEKHLSGVKHDDVDDFNLLEDLIRQELTHVISKISSEFNTETFPGNLDHKFRPDELLIDYFCQCCWVQCPFCKAICTNTIEHHDGDHSVAFHRVTGINGTCFNSTQNLCFDICTHLVAHDLNFRTPDGRFIWKEIKLAGHRFDTWSITPDLPELPYWNWFVCRFQKQLEKYYNKTFDGQGKIPDEWRRYSKEDAIESLDDYI